MAVKHVGEGVNFGVDIVNNVIYVDGSRGDTYVEDGTIRFPFKTIASALAVATAGKMILLFPATYSEQITLKDGVSIVGVERDRVLITSALDTITMTDGAYCVVKDVKITTSANNSKSALKIGSMASGWLKLQNVWIGAEPLDYSIYCNGGKNLWGRYVETEGGKVHIEASSGIHIDKMQFMGNDPVSALYIKDCTSDNAVIIRDGAILGINVGAGNKAVEIINSKVQFAENRFQSALDDVIDISSGADVVIATSDLVMNNPAKDNIVLDNSSALKVVLGDIKDLVSNGSNITLMNCVVDTIDGTNGGNVYLRNVDIKTTFTKGTATWTLENTFVGKKLLMKDADGDYRTAELDGDGVWSVSAPL
jgi:hypothetical protein